MACLNNHQCGKCPHPCKSEIREKEHNKWYSSLVIADKERLMGETYPKCSVLWNTLTQDEREELIEKSGIRRTKRKKTTSLGHDF